MTSAGEALFLSPVSPSYVLFFFAFFGSLRSSPLLLAPRPPGAATGDVYVHAGANFKPVTIAVTPFVGEAGGQDRQRRQQRLRPLDLPFAGQSVELSRDDHQSGRPPEHRRLEDGQRAIRADRPRAAAGHWPRDRPVPSVGRRDRRAGRRRAIYVRGRERAPRRAHDRRRGVLARDRREGLLRFPRRVRRRERSEGEAPQASRGDGHGRGQCEVPRRRGENLVVTPRFSPSAQQVAYMSFGSADPKVTLLNLETGQREAVGNFPGMTFAPRFSPDGQQIVMSLSDGANTNLYTMDLRTRATTRLTDTSAIDTSPDLLARRVADRVRIRPRRLAADLRDERDRRAGKAHLVRRRPATRRRSGRRAATSSPSPASRAARSASA